MNPQHWGLSHEFWNIIIKSNTYETRARIYIYIFLGCKHRASEGVFYIGGRRLVKLKLYSLFKSGRTKHNYTIEIPLNSPAIYLKVTINYCGY